MAVEGEVTEAEILSETKAPAGGDAGEALMPLQSGSLVEAQTRGEFMTQVDVAKRYPRSVAAFKRDMTTMATMTKEIASSCMYLLPGRGDRGKPISGPSIRMAEIMATAWGNLRMKAGLVAIEEQNVIVTATVWDMERNMAHTEELTASIMSKYGRYKPEMITVAIRAAQKKCLRNAILAVVPRAYYEEVKDKIVKVAAGTEKDLKKAAADMVAYLKATYQVTDAQVLAVLRRETVDEITAEDLAIIRMYVTSIKEEEVTAEEVFGKAQTATDNLADRLAKRDKKAEQKPAEAEPAPQGEPAEPEKGKKGRP